MKWYNRTPFPVILKCWFGSSFGACSLGESWGLWVSEQLKCLCASIVSAICSRAALAQTCHTIAALLFYFCNSWAKEPWSVGKNRENQRKILGVSNLCSKTWIREPRMLVLPAGDVRWSSPLTLEQFLVWYLSWIQAEFSGRSRHWWEDVVSSKERWRLETAQSHSLLCQELCSIQPGISLCSAELTAAQEHKWWQELYH